MPHPRPPRALRAARSWLAAACLGFTLAIPSPAAAATWSTASEAAFPDSYRAFQDTYGGAIAWFEPAQQGGVFAWETAGLPEGTSGTTLLALRADGSLGPEMLTPGTYLGATADAGGDTTVLLTGPPEAGADRDRLPAGVHWRRYDRSGQLLASGQFSDRRVAIQPAVAANPRGDVLAVWLEGKRGDYRLRAATRRAGEPGFGAPATLGSDRNQIGFVAADVSDDGRLLVACEGLLRGTRATPKHEPSPQVSAWTGTIDRGLSARQSIGRRDQSTSLSAAFDGRGRGYVVWQGTGRGPTTPQLASLPPGAAKFGAPIDLDPRQNMDSEPVLAADPAGGGAVVAWARDQRYPAYAATISSAGRVAARDYLGIGLPSAAATMNGVSAVAVDVSSARTRFAVRERGAADFSPLERPDHRSFYADSVMLVVEPGGQLRVTGEITDRTGRARLLALRRSAH